MKISNPLSFYFSCTYRHLLTIVAEDCILRTYLAVNQKQNIILKFTLHNSSSLGMHQSSVSLKNMI